VRRNGLSSAACASPTLVSDQWALPVDFLAGAWSRRLTAAREPDQPTWPHRPMGLGRGQRSVAENADGPPLRPIETVVREHADPKPLPMRARRKTVKTAAEPGPAHRPGTLSLGLTVGQLPAAHLFGCVQ
jgi:hypothetical protein